MKRKLVIFGALTVFVVQSAFADDFAINRLIARLESNPLSMNGQSIYVDLPREADPKEVIARYHEIARPRYREETEIIRLQEVRIRSWGDSEYLAARVRFGYQEFILLMSHSERAWFVRQFPAE